MDKALISRNTSTILKGVLCIFVLFHHLLNTSNAFINSILNVLGPLSVGGFFLLSGYGIVVNYKKYGVSYLKKLLFKRIPLTYLIVILTNIVYLVLYLFTTSSDLTAMNVITSIFYFSFSKDFILLYSWIYFLVDLIIYYLFFVVVFAVMELCKKIKQKAKVGAIVYFLIVFLIFLLVSLIIQKPLEQRAIFCFSLGIIVGAFESEIANFCVKRRIELILSAFLLLALLFIWSNLEIVKEQIMPIVFCLLLVISFAQTDLKSVPFMFIGKISLYIYLTHGFFLKLFNSFCNFSSFQNFILVSICSFSSASLIYLLKTCLSKHKKNNSIIKNT